MTLRRFRGRLICLGEAALLVLAGCETGRQPADSSPETAPPGFSQRDSAGVSVAITSGDLARDLLGWVVAETPDIIIGDDDTPAELLHDVRGITQLPDGRLVIVDGGSAEIRFFDGHGRPLGSLGGIGDGPGEFRSPWLVPWHGGDSLLVFDTRLRRLHLVSPDDLGYRVLADHAKQGMAVGAVGSRVFIVRSFVTSPTEPGVLHASVTHRWADLFSSEDTLVASFEMPRTWIEMHLEYAPSGWAIPFTNGIPPAAVSSRGAVLYHGGPSELREYDPDGRLRRVVRIDEPGRPVAPSMIETMIDFKARNSAGPRSDWARVYAEMPIPDTLPAFSMLVVDNADWLWAQSFQPEYEEAAGGPETWVVFDSDGRARGTVETPPGLEVREIGRDYILGVWANELGVEQVRRHPLRRTGGPG